MADVPDAPDALVERLQRVIAPVLKRLYPQNPDVVLGGEARAIARALIEVDITRFLAGSATPPEAPQQTADGAALIAAERRRQVEAEGWTPEHDAEHDGSELLAAAGCYLTEAIPPEDRDQFDGAELLDLWPWNRSYWKPSPDPTRNLVKAGALIAAEIDRLALADAVAPTGTESVGHLAVWHCEADAEGLQTAPCSPDHLIHGPPCGWRPTPSPCGSSAGPFVCPYTECLEANRCMADVVAPTEADRL